MRSLEVLRIAFFVFFPFIFSAFAQENLEPNGQREHFEKKKTEFLKATEIAINTHGTPRLESIYKLHQQTMIQRREQEEQFKIQALANENPNDPNIRKDENEAYQFLRNYFLELREDAMNESQIEHFYFKLYAVPRALAPEGDLFMEQGQEILSDGAVVSGIVGATSGALVGALAATSTGMGKPASGLKRTSTGGRNLFRYPILVARHLQNFFRSATHYANPQQHAKSISRLGGKTVAGTALFGAVIGGSLGYFGFKKWSEQDKFSDLIYWTPYFGDPWAENRNEAKTSERGQFFIDENFFFFLKEKADWLKEYEPGKDEFCHENPRSDPECVIPILIPEAIVERRMNQWIEKKAPEIVPGWGRGFETLRKVAQRGIEQE